MNKFLFAFAAVLAVCSSVNAGAQYGGQGGYGSYSTIGGYALQQQPAVTVQYLVPQYQKSYAPSYAPSYSPSYSPSYAPSYSPSYAPTSYQKSYGVDAEALQLAYQALAAPSAGLPVIPAEPSYQTASILSIPTYNIPAPAPAYAPSYAPSYAGSGDAATAASAAAAASNAAQLSVGQKSAY